MALSVTIHSETLLASLATSEILSRNSRKGDVGGADDGGIMFDFDAFVLEKRSRPYYSRLARLLLLKVLVVNSISAVSEFMMTDDYGKSALHCTPKL